MKAVALILALAFVAGCSARAVPPEILVPAEIPTAWEDAVDRFWTYIADLNTRADGVVTTIKASQLSRELDTLITDTMGELSVYTDDITTKLAPYSTGQLTEDMQLLASRLQADMLDAKEKSTKYLEEARAVVEQNADEVNSRLSTYTHKLKKRLHKDTEEIRNTVSTYMGEVESRTSQNMDMVKERVQPYLSQAHGSATEKLGTITALLKTQAEGLSQQLETQVGDLKTQLDATAEELRVAMEDKLEQLGDMLAPSAAKLREQLQVIVDKVKENVGN